MPSAVKYLSNVSKSIKYATVDAFKQLNPIIVEGVEENRDVAKVTYTSIKNIKQTTQKAYKSLANSQVGELAKEAKKNLFEDIKNGTFYNKRRQDITMNEAASSLALEDDFSDFMVDQDNDDLGFGDNDNEFLAESIEDTAERSTSAVSNVIARTAEYQVEATRQSTTRILAQTVAMTSTLHADLAALNGNIAGIVNFNNEAMATHIENSTRFYERQQEQMSEQTSILKEMLDIQKSVFTPTSKNPTAKLNISDVFTSSGMINLANYFKFVQQNVREQDSGYGDMIKMMLDMGMGKNLVSNPIGAAMTMAIKGAIPAVMKEAMQDFNEVVAGAMSTALLNITKNKDSMNSVKSFLGNIFGLDLSTKTTISTSEYKKDAVPWTGKDHKALTEVIPTLLGKIYSSVSGSGEMRYDYEAGRFKSIKQIKKDFAKEQKSYIRDANSDIIDKLQDQINRIDFKGDRQRQEELIKNIERIMEYNFKNLEKFNPKDKSMSAKKYGLKGDHAEYDLKLIREMWSKIPIKDQLAYSRNLMEATQRLNDTMRRYEESGDSIYNALFDGSISKNFSANAGKKTTKAAGKTKAKKKSKSNISDLGFFYSNILNDDKYAMSIDDEDINLDFDKEVESKFIKDIKDADTATKKLKAFFKGSGASILEKPAKLISGVLYKVDQRIYDLLFNDKDDDFEPIMERLRDGFTDWFDSLKTTTRKKLDEIKDAISESTFKDKASSIMKSLFGFDFKDWEKDLKKALFGEGKEDTPFIQGFKDVFKEGFSDMWRGLKKFFKPEKDNGIGKVTGAASGKRRVTKTGVIAVSEGEMIIPPDQNPYNINKRYKNENKAIKQFEKSFGDVGYIPAFAEGGTAGDKKFRSKEEWVEYLRNLMDNSGWDLDRIASLISDKVSDKDFTYIINRLDKITRTREKVNKAFNAASNFGKAMGREAKGFANNAMENVDIKEFVESITGVFNERMPEEGKDVAKDVFRNFSSYLPRMAAGSVTGLGSSALLGLAGGPVLGAAVGAGLGLLSKSEKLQTLLFGKEVVDEEGNKSRDGSGLISKDIVQNINKYFPGMAKGAIVGGIASILPFVPGGPMAGILVGSAIGFARSNEDLRQSLFGDGKKLEKIKETVKQKLPKIGLGAAVGMLTGPFGLTTNLLVGGALGFVSDTEKFKEIVFGTKGFDGKRAGGIVGFIKDAATIPINMAKDLLNFGKDQLIKGIVEPMKRFIEPAFQDLKNFGSWVKDGIKGALRDHLLRPIGARILEHIIKPVEKVAQKTLTPLFKGLMFGATMPFRALGKFGDWRRGRQLRSVGGAAGTTAERIRARAERDSKRGGTKYTDSEANKVDMAAMGLSDKDASNFATIAEMAEISGLRSKDKKEKAIKSNIARMIHQEGAVDKVLYSYVRRNPGDTSMLKDFEDIKTALLDGNEEIPLAIIDRWAASGKMPAEDKKDAVKLIKETVRKVNQRKKDLINFKKKAEELKEKTGIDVFNRKHRKVLKQRSKELGLDNESSMKEYYDTISEDIYNQEATEKQIDIATKIEEGIQGVNKNLEGISDLLREALGLGEKATESPEPTEPEKLLPMVISNANVKGTVEKVSGDVLDKDGNIIAKNKNNKIDNKENIAKPTVTDIFSAIQAGDYALARNLASGRVTKFGRFRTFANSMINKFKKKSEKPGTIMTDAGPIKMRKDRQGNDIPDERDSETKETLAIQEEERNTQRGIFDRLSNLGSTLKGLLFGKEEEEEEESWLDKILKYALPVLGGILGIGAVSKLMGHEITTTAKDENGNVILDENGNPITEQTTVGNLIMDKLKALWLGDDGTGNTDGIWFHIKDFTRNTLIPTFGAGIQVILDNIPKLVEKATYTIITNAPKILWPILKGVGSGIVSLFKKALSHLPIIGGAFKEEDTTSQEDIDNVNGSIEGVTLASGITPLGSTNMGTSTGNTTGTPSTKSGSENEEFSGNTVVQSMQAAFDKATGWTGGNGNNTTIQAANTSGVSQAATASNTGSTTNTSGSNNMNRTITQDIATMNNQTTQAASSIPNAKGGMSRSSKEIEKEIKASSAYKKASSAMQDKALKLLPPVWDSPITAEGYTVGQILNDNNYVVMYRQDPDTGEQIPIVGSDLLLEPALITHLLGIDFSLTAEEIQRNTEELNVKAEKNPGNYTALKILLTGGQYGKHTARLGIRIVSAGSKVGGSIGVGAGKFLSKFGMPGKILGLPAQVAGHAMKVSGQIATIPMRIMEGGRQIVEDFAEAKSVGYSTKRAAQHAATNLRYRAGEKVKGAREAFNNAMDSKVADRAKKANKKWTKVGKKIQEAKNFVPNKITETIKNAGNKVFDKVDNITSGKTGKSAGMAADAIKKSTEKITNSKAGKAGKKVIEGLSDTIDYIVNGIKNLFKDNKVINKIKTVFNFGKKSGKGGAKKAISEAADKLVSKISKGLKNMSDDVAGSLVGKIAGKFLTVVFIVADFIDGWTNADRIMKVQKPTVVEKFISAAINTLANLFFLTLVFSSSEIEGFLEEFVRFLGVDMSNLDKRREETEKARQKYNQEHDSDLNMEEFLSLDDSALKKAWNSLKDFWKNNNNYENDPKVQILKEKQQKKQEEKEKKEKEKKKKEKEKENKSNTKRVTEAENKAAQDPKETARRNAKQNSKAGSGLLAGLKAGLTSVFSLKGKSNNKEDKAEEVTIPIEESNIQNTESQSMDIGMQDTSYLNGNITGTDTSNLIPYQDTTQLYMDTDTVNQNPMQEGSSIISTQNQSAINQAYSDINASIPNMIKEVKSRLAQYFGLNTSDMNRTSNVAGNKYRGATPKKIFEQMTKMWTRTNTLINPILGSLPKTISTATKEVSKFLSVAFGLSDPTENIGIDEATQENYLNRRAQTIANTSVFSSLLGTTSVTGSNSASETTQTSSMNNRTSGRSTSSSLGSKVKNFIGKVFGFGGGSGSGVSGDKAGLYATTPDVDPAITNFVSQKYSGYANKTFSNTGTRKQTVKDAGCAPAVATMAINSKGYAEPITMDQAMKDALPYKQPGGGVTADYFIEEFRKHNLHSAYMIGQSNKRIKQMKDYLRAGNSMILMGKDETNTTKNVSPFGPNAHYVYAVGISKDGKTIYINDPEARQAKIPYPTERVLKHTTLGIAPQISRKKTIPRVVTQKAQNALKAFSGQATKEEIEKKVWNALTGAGYNENATAAAMGNIYAESGFNPATIEKGSGVGFGLCQWSYSRRDLLESTAKQQGKDPADVDFQISFLLGELKEAGRFADPCSSKYGLGSLRKSDWENGDIETATKAFMCCFERPSYDSSVNHIDKRIEMAKQYYQQFTGSNPIGSGGSGEQEEVEEQSNNPITRLLAAFDKLANAYGVGSGGDSGSTGTGSSGGVDGTTSEKQQALVDKMMSVKGQLQYSQVNRNPDTGSGDCSSTVQWAYKNVLNVDPGSWTGAQETDEDLYTVANDVNDPSKLAKGDLILYRKGGQSSHVEMYAGDNQMIGHGSGMGPKIKSLMQTMGSQSVAMVRRWTGFKEGGSGSGLNDNKKTKNTPDFGGYGFTVGSNDDELPLISGSGMGSGLSDWSSSTPSFNYNNATATPSNRGSSMIVDSNYRKSSTTNIDKLIEVVISLLGQVVNNTSSIKDIAALVVKIVDMKSSSVNESGLSSNDKAIIGTELAKTKSLALRALEGDDGETADIQRLIKNVEAIARQ